MENILTIDFVFDGFVKVLNTNCGALMNLEENNG